MCRPILKDDKMGTLSPKDQNDLLFGCAAFGVMIAIIVGSIGFALFSLGGWLLS